MSVEVAFRAAMVLAASLVAARALAPAAAATRHLLWRWVMLATLLLPLTSLVVPTWGLPSAVPMGLDVPGGMASTATAASRSTAAWRVEAWAGVAWAVGAASVALYVLAGHGVLMVIRRRSWRAPSSWYAAAERISHRLGARTAPEVRVSPLVPGPVVGGLFRPVVLIPPEATTWTGPRRDTALAHEVAHILRRDIAAQVLAQAVCVLHWFNPLAWMAAAAMRREREHACDDLVLRTGVVASDYASDLLAIAAEGLHRLIPASALAMARPSELEGRLVAVLADRPRRTGRAGRLLVPVLAVCGSAALAGATSERPAAFAPAPPSASLAVGAPWLQPGSLPDTDVDTSRLWMETASAREAPPRERSTVVLALTPGHAVVPALIERLADADSRVREKAAVGLAWRRDPRIVPALLAAATDPDSRVREKVLVALAFSGDRRARPAIEAAQEDRDAQVREKAHTLALLP